MILPSVISRRILVLGRNAGLLQTREKHFISPESPEEISIPIADGIIAGMKSN